MDEIPANPLCTQFVSSDGSVCVFRTNKDALNYRLVSIDLTRPEQQHWTELLPEDPKHVLDWVQPVHVDKMLCCYIQDVKVGGRERGVIRCCGVVRLGGEGRFVLVVRLG